MSTALADIQTAIHDTLTNDAALMALVSGVYDDVPDGAAFPYIVIGEAFEVPMKTFDRDGHDNTQELHVWSHYKGFKEVYDILAEANRLLDDVGIPVSDHHLVRLHAENVQAFRDEDGEARHLIARYRCMVQEV